MRYYACFGMFAGNRRRNRKVWQMTEKSVEIGQFVLKVDKKEAEDVFAERISRFAVWNRDFWKNFRGRGA